MQKLKELYLAFVAAYNVSEDQKRTLFTITADELATFMKLRLATEGFAKSPSTAAGFQAHRKMAAHS